MSKKKKIVILSCMVLLLAATAVCNFLLTNRDGGGQTVSTASYFTEYRNEHAARVNEQMLQLDSIIKQADDDSEAKENALKTKLKLSEIVEKELRLESLIKAKGYKNTVVMIGLDSDNVTVVVEDDDFTTDDAVAIYTLLVEEIKASPEIVRILPIS